MTGTRLDRRQAAMAVTVTVVPLFLLLPPRLIPGGQPPPACGCSAVVPSPAPGPAAAA